MGLAELAFALVKPSNALFLTLALGLVLALRRRRAGLALIALALVGGAACAYLPVGRALLAPLEVRTAFPGAVGPLDGIVVLGGFMRDDVPSALPLYLAAGNAPERLITGATLAHAHPSVPLILSDGNDAPSAARHLVALGLDRERIVVEDRSRSTYENAAFAHALVAPQAGGRYALVTSAWHMPRALATFRAAGWPELVAIPVDRMGAPDTIWRGVPLDPTQGLRQADIAAREWAAVVYYRLTGRTDRLLGPA